MFISSLLCKFWTEDIKLQEIFNLQVVKKLYFGAFIWTKNVTKTFSSVKCIETNKIFDISGKKPFLFQLRGCKQETTAIK